MLGFAGTTAVSATLGVAVVSGFTSGSAGFSGGGAGSSGAGVGVCGSFVAGGFASGASACAVASHERIASDKPPKTRPEIMGRRYHVRRLERRTTGANSKVQRATQHSAEGGCIHHVRAQGDLTFEMFFRRVCRFTRAGLLSVQLRMTRSSCARSRAARAASTRRMSAQLTPAFNECSRSAS